MNNYNQYDAGTTAKDYAEGATAFAAADAGRHFLQKQLEPLDRALPLLDLGCGAGHDLRTYYQMGFTNLTGVDISTKHLEEARKFLPLEITLDTASFENLPYKDGTFGIVTSRFVLHYARNISLVIDEAARVLRPGGILTCILSHPQVDALEEVDSNGNVHVTLYRGRVSIQYPQHSLNDIFSKRFEELFRLTNQREYFGKERDNAPPNVANALCFTAIKR